MGISQYDPVAKGRPAWNAGKQVGAKRALKVEQIWLIRFFLDRGGRMRDRALFDLAIDSKLRGCDLVKIKISSLVSGPTIRNRSMVIQQKTGRPVQFEIIADTRGSLLAWLERRGGSVDDFAFPSRVDPGGHLSTRQYARLVDEWVTAIFEPLGVSSEAADGGTSAASEPVVNLIKGFPHDIRVDLQKSLQTSRFHALPSPDKGGARLLRCRQARRQFCLWWFECHQVPPSRLQPGRMRWFQQVQPHQEKAFAADLR